MRVNGIELWFESAGDGPPLLLLHGMGGCAEDWKYFGRDALAREHRTIAVDARGHGHSTNDRPALTHRQCAADVLALLDALGLVRCAAIGLSMGGNTLLHVASQAPERIEAMVLVSATPRFGEQARALMRAVSSEGRSEADWREMRGRHVHGDAQIEALWQAQRALADGTDDVNFSAADLARIRARTLVVYGDRDPLYPVEYGVELYRGIPDASLWVVPGGGHGPIAGENEAEFTRRALTAIRPSSG
jgi:pimeloyl-ACP methyl ester carboxylesterase